MVGGKERHIHAHTKKDTHINTMTQPGLRAGPSEKEVFNTRSQEQIGLLTWTRNIHIAVLMCLFFIYFRCKRNITGIGKFSLNNVLKTHLWKHWAKTGQYTTV